MAQTGYTPIQLYRTATASAAPVAGNLSDGELAINTNDGKLFYKDSGGVVQTIASKAAAALTIGGSNTQIQFNNSGAFGGSANLTWNGTTLATTGLSASGTVSGTGFSTYLASPPAIGGTAPAAGAFTTLSASSTVSGTGFSTYLASPPAIGGTTPAAGAFTTLSASSTVSGTGFSTYLASPPAIGGSAAAAGTFTTLTASTTLIASKNAYANIIALTDAATIAVDMSLGNNFSVTLGGNRTLGNPTNLTAGQSGIIYVTQDATGSRTLAYSSYWKFPGGTAPTLTTTANAVDALVYTVRTSTSITVQSVLNIG